MKPLDINEVFKLHREKFGVDPVFYGRSTIPRINLVADAIERGEPHIEEPIPDGVDI